MSNYSRLFALTKALLSIYLEKTGAKTKEICLLMIMFAKSKMNFT